MSALEGILIKRNAKNKFVVFQLHYTADPSKRNSEELDAIKASMPIAQWKQEFEINWDSFAGMPVYQDFAANRHISATKPEAEIGLPLLRGWDFGLTPACVIAQMQGTKLVVLREYVDFNMGAEQFCQKYLPLMYQEFPHTKWLDFADPAGVAKAQSDERACFEVLGGFGLQVIPGPVPFEERKQGVEWFLTRKTREGECFEIYEETSPTLVRGFKGGYRYPEKAKDIEPEKLRPLKDAHSHPHDALQYIAACVKRGDLKSFSHLSIPTQSYFQGASR